MKASSCSARRGRSAKSCTSRMWSAMRLLSRGCTLIERGRDGTEPGRAGAARSRWTRVCSGAAGLAYVNLQEAAVRAESVRARPSAITPRAGPTAKNASSVCTACACRAGGRSRSLLRGQWDEAADISARDAGPRGISPVNRLNPLRVLGAVRGRRGEAGAWELLDEALALAEGNGEPPWIVAVRAARAELSWISGRADLAAAEARAGATSAGSGAPTRGCSARVAIWLSRLQQPLGEPSSGLPEPYALEMAR